MANDPQLEKEPTQELSQAMHPPRVREADLHRGDVLAARYEIQELLGRGGMASVYRAFDRVTEQTIAIKVLDDDRSAARGWVEHLGRELRHARRIKHPNVCQVFDFFEDDGRCFLTMELAPGGTLRDALDAADSGRPLADRLSDARAVIEGVAAIHEAGVVHRDLKPENVLRAADGRLMVSDLGVAIRADLTTHSGGPAGTRSYMAPELLFGEKATKASDVWSLGLILHEILFGCRPEWSLIGDVRRLNLPAGASGIVMHNLVRLCAGCLAELPDRRVSDALAVRERFEEAIRGKRLRGRRTLVLMGAAVLALSPVPFILGGKGTDVPRSIMTGTAVDLAQRSSVLFTADRDVNGCAQMLPGGRTLRLFLRRPTGAIDVDLAGGVARPSNLVAEAVNSGCPQLSPDGRRLLYERLREEGRPQVMLSDWPDGRDARVVTEGEGPFWLATGDAFLYAMDTARSAIFAIGRGPMLFPETGQAPRRISSHGVNGAGDQVALAFMTNVPSLALTLDIFSYPQTALLRRASFPAGAFPWVEFDSGRGSWQISLRDREHVVRCEPRDDGTCARLLKLDGADVLASYRSTLGLVALVSRRSRTAVVTRKADGKTQEYLYQGWAADFGPQGQAVFGVALDDGRVVIAAQRFGESQPRIVSRGPIDVSPTINADGTTFLYSAGGRDVYSCSIDAVAPDGCRVIHSDPLGPAYARLSPDGRYLAYNVADASGWRVRIISMQGQPMRDLSVRSAGPILWTSNTTLWSCEGDARAWSEVDAVGGHFTGKRISRSDPATVCDPPPGMGELTDFDLRRQLHVTTEVRLVRGL